MSIKNLHSLLSGNWYIEEQYALSHLPLLLNLLDGKNNITKGTPEDIIEFAAHGKPSLGYANEGTSTASTVAILSVKNPILKFDQECGPRGTKSMMRTLDSFKTDDSVLGIVLDIDSGGGQSYGTPEFHDYILNYPKPIVAYTDGYMCSAAYYIGSAASYIIANKRADAIGSIGAYTQVLDITGYYEKLGAKVHTVYATKSTEKNKAYRELLEGDYKTYIKEELDPLVDTFIADMKNARKSIDDSVFMGATYNSEISLEKGLVDEIGTMQTAIEKVFELSKSNKNQNQLSTMNKKFTRVQTVLEMEANFESNENGVFVSEEQLDLLETALETQATAIADATIAGDTAITAATDPLNATISALADEGVEVTAAIDAALTEAEVVRGTMTNAQAVAHLSGLVTEYGAKDGTKPTKTKTDADSSDLGKDNVLSGVDLDNALNC